MPASIFINQLSWSRPDGDPLFSNLNLRFASQRTGLIGRNGTGKTTLLKLISGALKPVSGSVSVQGTLGLLEQQVQYKSDQTVAHLFNVAGALRTLRKAEAGIASVEELAAADWTLESRMESALAVLGLSIPADYPLAKLSGGQTTRCRLAALHFHETDFLLLDEPTNNLDAAGRMALLRFLEGWKKGVIVVSHDRALLEQMDAIVELTTLGASSFGGNYSFYKSQKEQELTSAMHEFARAEKRKDDLGRKLQKLTERKARKDGVGYRSRAKRDQPKVLLNARRETAETTRGDSVNLANRLRQQAQHQADMARQKVEVLEPISMHIPSSGLTNTQRVLTARNLSVGYAKHSPLLQGFSLEISGPHRCALSGGNGSGKTTLLKTLLGEIPPLSGICELHPTTRVLDQQASFLDPERSVLENFHHLNPDQDENTCHAVLARFLFRGNTSHQPVKTLSGGMMLRAGLACTLGAARPPKLLILDEPTNHLDIEGIEAMEAALKAYDGALLVVSHDRSFLNNIGITQEICLGETAEAQDSCQLKGV